MKHIKTKDGRIYSVDASGTRSRVAPRPWHGKSERRQVIKKRRLAREMAA